jgi:hypothetical protein
MNHVAPQWVLFPGLDHPVGAATPARSCFGGLIRSLPNSLPRVVAYYRLPCTATPNGQGTVGGELRLQSRAVVLQASRGVQQRRASSIARVTPLANTATSGTTHTPCPICKAPTRRSSRHTATRCRDGSAGSRTTSTSHRTTPGFSVTEKM